jgi:aspartate carbamoyltransferase catalytic subunit
MEFKGSHILSTHQFERADIERVIEVALELEPIAKKEKSSDLMKGKILAALFYEPSTRTRLSTETAMHRLGGSVITAVGEEYSSLLKGETLYDTGKMVSNYADVIAMRHKKEGSVDELSKGSSVPVINCGDGPGQHPTQALLDMFTIQKECGKIDGLTIAMSGDLKFGRTVHSLVYLLRHFKVKMIFVAPEKLKMPEEIKEDMKAKGISFEETTDFVEGIKKADVLYQTRVQKERFDDLAEYEALKHVYVLNKQIVEENNPDLVIMHPLPRIGEITEDADELKGAAYFRQAGNAVAVRMALISLVLGKY